MDYIWDGMQSFLYKILLLIDSVIYYLIDICYQVFLVLAKARIFSDDLFGSILKRFYILIGVLMLFFVVYTLLKVIVNPDDMTKGNLAPGKVITNILTSIPMLAFLPTGFNLLYQAQGVILDNNLIGKIVMDGATKEEVESSVKIGGRQIAVGVFSAFFYPEGGKDDSEIKAEAEYFDHTYTLKEAKDAFVKEEVGFAVFTSFSANAAKEEIHYSWFVSAVAGGFCLYVVVSFVFDLGIRAAKLGVLQIIAPIPILMRILPGKDKTFSNWISTTLGTFFEVFVRVFIIYLIAFIAGQIDKIMSDLMASVGGVKFPINLMAKAFLLMGVIAFGKQAPKMISDLLGLKTGDMKLGIKDKLKEGGGFVAAGAIGAGATTGIRNLTNGVNNFKHAKGGRKKVGAAFKTIGSTIAGTASGVIRGGVGGSKANSYADLATNTSRAAQNAVDKRDARASYIQEHGGVAGAMKGHVKDARDSIVSWATGENTQALQERRNKISAVQAANNDVFSEIKKDVLENEDKYVVLDRDGNQRLLSHLHQEMDQASHAVTTFDRQKYISDLVSSGKTKAEAEEAADKEVKRLTSVQFNAQSAYNKALDDVIKVQNEYERGAVDAHGNPSQTYMLKNEDGNDVVGVKFKNEQIQVQTDGTVKILAQDSKGAITGGRVNTVDVKINAAMESIQSNRAEIMQLADQMRKEVNSLTGEPVLSDDDYNTLKDALENPHNVVDKSVRNAVGNIVNEMDKEIARRRQKESKDKK